VIEAACALSTLEETTVDEDFGLLSFDEVAGAGHFSAARA